MKAVYVCQSGKKQFSHNCSTFIPQVQIVLFIVLQTDKTKTLSNILSLKKKSSSRRYPAAVKNCLICLHFKVQMLLDHPVRGDRNPSSLREDYIGTSNVYVHSSHILCFCSLPFSQPLPTRTYKARK